MNMSILDIEDVDSIEETDSAEPAEKIPDPVIIESPDESAESTGESGFGSVNMWNLRGGRKSSGSYQSSDKFSI